MIFTYKVWESFCEKLNKCGISGITAEKVMLENTSKPYIVLKHDVETNVSSAYKIAEIEHRLGHNGSYYVQAYLLKSSENVKMLKTMQNMGHEISYHYDVMDANGGNIEKAVTDFNLKRNIFEQNGFKLTTVCQHGNPVVERIGYYSNRDFMRNEKVSALYPDLADIMVNFKEKAKGGTDYLYVSDAGGKFNLIFDPINNDIIPSDNKNIPFDTLEKLFIYINEKNENAIISIHPHRWVSSKFKYTIKTSVFKLVRFTARFLVKIPLMKRFMSKYYYLAKKI